LKLCTSCVLAVSISLAFISLTPQITSALTRPRHLGIVEGTETLRNSSLAAADSLSINKMIALEPSQATVTTSAPTIGFVKVQPDAGASTPAGVALLGFSSGGTLVTETGVPASTLTQSGRVFVEVNGPVNTGVVVANPNDQNVVVSFYFTDGSGTDFGHGAFTLAPRNQVASLLNAQPFNGRTSMFGTFTFNSSAPVSTLALRRYTNERGESVVSSLPLAPLGTPGAGTRLAVPHFATESWYTQLVLTNPTNAAISGATEFFDAGPKGDKAIRVRINGVLASSFRYSVPPRSAIRLLLNNSADRAAVDSIHIVPTAGNTSPVGLVMFSYKPGGILLSEASVPVVRASSRLRLHMESAGAFGQVDSIETGLTIDNTSRSSASVQLIVTGMDGVDTGLTASLNIPGGGQVAKLTRALFPNLPSTFRGIVRVTSSAAVTMSGMRMHYNERGDLLAAAMPVWDDEIPPGRSDVYFPHVAIEGGFATRLVLINPASPTSSGKLWFFSQTGALLPAASLVRRD
jgi:hypothetical protein